MREDCWYKDVCNQSTCDGCIRFEEMNFLIQSSGMPKRLQTKIKLRATNEHDLASFKKLSEIKDNIEDFVENGRSLYITSNNTGNGKTSWAAKLMLRYFDRVWSGNCLTVRGLFVHVPTFLNKLKDFEQPLSAEYKEYLKECDLVVWDDISSTRTTEYEYNQLLMYIDARVSNGKSNIYTSNVNDKEVLDELLGSRLTSRIYNNSEVIDFTANDFRSILK